MITIGNRWGVRRRRRSVHGENRDMSGGNEWRRRGLRFDGNVRLIPSTRNQDNKDGWKQRYSRIFDRTIGSYAPLSKP